MKRSINREQGAVLVVALIMLAMITFLVVAFVGFARFERASVTASMRRTQAEFVAGDSLTMAQRQAISGLTNTVPHGLLVSKRSGGIWCRCFSMAQGMASKKRNRPILT